MSYEELLQKSGSFGKYQHFVCFLLFLSTFSNGYFSMSSVFTANTPDHHCEVTNDKNLSQEEFLNSTIPWVLQKDGVWKRSQCLEYLRPVDLSLIKSKNTTELKTTKCRNGWKFYTSEGEVTVVTEFNMVCDRAWQKPFTTSLYLTGVLIGSFLGGPLSDKYGRRVLFLWATYTQAALLFLTGFSPSVLIYGLGMLLSGLTGLVNYMSGFLLVSEIIDTSKRALVSAYYACGFSIGYMLLPVLVYFVSNWRRIFNIMGLLGCFFIPYYWVLPESPRWLISKGKIEEANRTIRKMLKVNRKNWEDKEIENLLSNALEKDDSVQKKTNQFKLLMELMKQKNFRTRSLVMYFLWFTISLSYYCLSLGTSDMGGNKFINCFIAAAVEIPSNILAFYCVEKVGRRRIISPSFAVAGLFCVITPFIGAVGSVHSITSAMISKFVISGVFNCMYMYCSELFPTLLRNSSMGMSSTFARVGSILSPYLIFAGYEFYRPMPYIMMGFFCVFSAVLCLLLPETKSKVLPDTFEEAINLDRYKLNWKLLSSKKEVKEDMSEKTNLA